MRKAAMDSMEKQVSGIKPKELYSEARNQLIIRTSILGISANVMLALLKALVGMATHSIAITLDAVNNFTDAGSSVITIAGTKLASKKPDKKHPWGHGRIEYLSAMLLGTLVLSAGISSMIEAVRKILLPQKAEYTSVSLILVAICVLVKIFLGRYVISAGKRANSETLVNSGRDALLDALVSATTLAAALIYLVYGISLEAWLGALICVLIIRTGVEMQLNTISEILGQRVDPDIVRAVQKTVESFDEVHGVYDMIFHDYGPGRVNGSLHVEVDDTMTAREISDLLRRIAVKVYQEHQVQLTAVGIYSMNIKDKKAVRLREEITKIAMAHSHVLQLHGFSLNDNIVQFDIIVDFEADDPEKIRDEIAAEVSAAYPELTVQAFCDADYTFSE
jgi:cation diffusion facilitator family transporter